MLDILLAVAFWFSGATDISTPQIAEKNTDFHASSPVKITRKIIKKVEINSSKWRAPQTFSPIDKKSSQIEDWHPVARIDQNFRKALPTPEIVKGIYMTGYSLASKKRRTELFNLIKKTELNAVVIDFQDPDGYLMFPVEDKELQKIKLAEISFSREKFREILADLQKEGIYTIARLTTFQDEGSVRAFPDLALKNKWKNQWKNYSGLGWLDMTNEAAWEIPVKKALEAAEIGFDEIQFDYIRFPSDGRLSLISYENLGNRKKYEIMTEFFEFLHDKKSEIGLPISADLFGVTYSRYADSDRDLAIGQRLVDAVKYFDYLSPMIYPSHYSTGHIGYSNPANFPYQVVNRAMEDGHDLIEKYTEEPVSKSRPWLQAFNIGAVYDSQKIKAQIRAVDENGGSGWILWNARNVYGVGLKRN